MHDIVPRYRMARHREEKAKVVEHAQCPSPVQPRPNLAVDSDVTAQHCVCVHKEVAETRVHARCSAVIP